MGERFAQVSTHVLDTGRGIPAAGVHVRLERHDSGGWSLVAQGRTDTDGRLRDWVPLHACQAGGYRLVFFVDTYFDGDTFFPEITVAFRLTDPDQRYHVPLLLGRHAYTTYRGS
ncbi:5-hydroxyisourate hydrolase [Micromonospora pisi]|uniref:5-hydroxyisourate hydrolase n=1 Tax=Micromonospora pisi TaxID=589240 RepID=A0A495JR68_9ACTN|nr:hydroxyisourate hydrolase [Micromonospora pisi]RKR91463.1 5-hydroxyisourate hydrolase [Micromonospora pisi]